MKRSLYLLFLTAGLLVAAVRAQSPTPTPGPRTTTSPTVADSRSVTPTPKPARTMTDANNTARNAGDAATGASTADQQPNDPADLKLLQAIRKAVIADATLSMGAKNCKIIVRDGLVTLRGSIESEKERATIDTLATGLAGKGKVTDLLEVKLSSR